MRSRVVVLSSALVLIANVAIAQMQRLGLVPGHYIISPNGEIVVKSGCMDFLRHTPPSGTDYGNVISDPESISVLLGSGKSARRMDLQQAIDEKLVRIESYELKGYAGYKHVRIVSKTKQRVEIDINDGAYVSAVTEDADDLPTYLTNLIAQGRQREVWHILDDRRDRMSDRLLEARADIRGDIVPVFREKRVSMLNAQDNPYSFYEVTRIAEPTRDLYAVRDRTGGEIYRGADIDELLNVIDQNKIQGSETAYLEMKGFGGAGREEAFATTCNIWRDRHQISMTIRPVPREQGVTDVADAVFLSGATLDVSSITEPIRERASNGVEMFTATAALENKGQEMKLTVKGRTVDLVRAFFTRIKQRMLGKSAYPLARVLHEIKNDLKKTFSKEELDSFVMQVGMIEITQIIRGVMPSWAIQTSSLFASFARPTV